MVEPLPESPSDARRALRLSAFTVVWNTIVGGTAVATAISTGSLALIGFGINAVVDSSVSVLLVWRFHAEDRGHAERAERAEARAERLAGVAFLLVAVYLAVQSIRTLATSGDSHSTTFGIVEAAAALLVLPFLARAKYTLALRIGSRALRADSLLTASGVALSAVALAALVLLRAFGWWWVDPAGALAIAVILAWQGSLTLRQWASSLSSTSASG
ncbi:MAG TPA: cation transporter [Gaiellaceae bacterium]